MPPRTGRGIVRFQLAAIFRFPLPISFLFLRDQRSGKIAGS